MLIYVHFYPKLFRNGHGCSETNQITLVSFKNIDISLSYDQNLGVYPYMGKIVLPLPNFAWKIRRLVTTYRVTILHEKYRVCCLFADSSPMGPKTRQKVGPLGGHFGSKLISKSCFRNFQA